MRSERNDAELEALARLREDEIDTSDIPEVTDWRKAEVGRFYRPIKEPVTIRLDVDVVAWLKAEGPGYQTRINALLREAMTGTAESKLRVGPETEQRDLPEHSFRTLEKHNVLHKYGHVAQQIAERHCLFA